MEPTKPTRSNLPSEAIELYNLFIHGEISRRDFMDGVQRFAIGGLAVAAVIEALMPNYALGQQVSKTDDRIKATYETVPSPQGNGSIKGYLVRPVSADTRGAMPVKLPGIIVVHENRGLNPHIEDVARRFALANFMAFAPDGLTSLGGFPGDDYRGGQMFNKVDGKKMTEDMVASAMWLKSRADCTGKIGATGFCYGGGIANTLAFRLGADLAAAAPFYGAVPAKDDIPKIKGAILVHHGELDTRLAATWPAYDAALKAINVPHEGYIYPGRRSRLQLRRDAGTLQQSRRRSGVAAHDRLVQQILARFRVDSIGQIIGGLPSLPRAQWLFHLSQHTLRHLRHDVVFRVHQFGDVVFQRRGKKNRHFAVTQLVVFLDPRRQLGRRNLNRLRHRTADAEGDEIVLGFGANLPAGVALDDIDGEIHVHRGLKRAAGHLAVTHGGVAVSHAQQRAGVKDRKVECCAFHVVVVVHVAAEWAEVASAKLLVARGCDGDATQHRLQRDAVVLHVLARMGRHGNALLGQQGPFASDAGIVLRLPPGKPR